MYIFRIQKQDFVYQSSRKGRKEATGNTYLTMNLKNIINACLQIILSYIFSKIDWSDAYKHILTYIGVLIILIDWVNYLWTTCIANHNALQEVRLK